MMTDLKLHKRIAPAVLLIFGFTLFVPTVALGQTPTDPPKSDSSKSTDSSGETPKSEEDKKGPVMHRLGMLAIGKSRRDAKPALLIQALFRRYVQELKGAQLVIPVEGSDPRQLIPIRRLLDQASKEMRAQRFDIARDLYKQAAGLFENYNGMPERRLMARLHKGLGLSHWLKGDKENARLHTRRSRLLWPDQSDMEWAYNLETSRAFRDVSVGWETTQPGTIEVNCNLGDAEVFVDGQSQGYAPVTIPRAAVGSHHLYVVRDGYKVYQSWVNVEAEETSIKVANLPGIDAITPYSRAKRRFRGVAKRARRAEKAMRSLAEHHGGLDGLLVLLVRKSGSYFELVGVRWDQSGLVQVREQLKLDGFLPGSIRGLVRTLYGLEYDAAAGNMALEAPVARGMDTPDMTGDGEGVYIKGGTEIFEEDKQKREATIFSKWWFWAGTAVLVGGAVTAVVVLSGGSGGSSPTGSVQINFNAPNIP